MAGRRIWAVAAALVIAGCRSTAAPAPRSPVVAGEAVPDQVGASDQVAHARELLVGDGDPVAARTLAPVLDKACSRGDANSCIVAGDLYARGIGVPQNSGRAWIYHLDGCDADPGWCRDLAIRYATGVGVARDEARAVTFIRSACLSDDKYCVQSVEFLLGEGGHMRDKAAAFELARMACRRVPAECQRLAKRFGRDSRLVLGKDACESDKSTCGERADELGPARHGRETRAAQRARARGLRDKMLRCPLGRRTAPGQPADGFDVGECMDLADIYAIGSRVDRDLERAVAYLEAACAAGSSRGCRRLAGHLRSGIGVGRDLERAATLYDSSCHADDPFACWRLGRMYARGRGVATDAERAKSLLSRACDRGVHVACTERDDL